MAVHHKRSHFSQLPTGPIGAHMSISDDRCALHSLTGSDLGQDLRVLRPRDVHTSGFSIPIISQHDQ
jgi:hypothetical protein